MSTPPPLILVHMCLWELCYSIVDGQPSSLFLFLSQCSTLYIQPCSAFTPPPTSLPEGSRASPSLRPFNLSFCSVFSSRHHHLYKQYTRPSNLHFDCMDVDEKQVFKMIEFKPNAETHQDSKRWRAKSHIKKRCKASIKQLLGPCTQMWNKRDHDSHNEQLFSNSRDIQRDGKLGSCCSGTAIGHNSALICLWRKVC